MARIGMVNFINTAPIYEVWKERISRSDWQVIEAPPSTLNRMLAADELDLGFVSSREYCLRPGKYQILADLSISATGPVGSVFLFSSCELRQLDGKHVLLTGQSDTSVSLVKIILEEFYQVRPVYEVGDLFSRLDHGEDIDAVLAIGDEALRLKYEDRYSFQFDLGEIWNSRTGLPFVFAVCAVRQEYAERNRNEIEEIHQELLTCRLLGQQRLEEICGLVAPRIPMTTDACHAYLQAMEYDLGQEKQKALEEFFSYLIKRGEAVPGSLPLKFFP